MVVAGARVRVNEWQRARIRAMGGVKFVCLGLGLSLGFGLGLGLVKVVDWGGVRVRVSEFCSTQM